MGKILDPGRREEHGSMGCSSRCLRAKGRLGWPGTQDCLEKEDLGSSLGCPSQDLTSLLWSHGPLAAWQSSACLPAQLSLLELGLAPPSGPDDTFPERAWGSLKEPHCAEPGRRLHGAATTVVHPFLCSQL